MSGEIVVCHRTPALARRARIFALQESMIEAIQNGQMVDRTETDLTHRFVPGGYARTMNISAGTLIVGKIHRNACFNFITRGRALVITENDKSDVCAPEIFVSGPGTKRAIYALEDLEWTTVHPTLETDLEEIEADLICESYADFDADKAREMLK